MPPKRKRGRPKVALSQRVLSCPCGGRSGNVICKMAVVCSSCNMCKAGCIANGKCNRTESPPSTPKRTRTATGSLKKHIIGSLADDSPLVNAPNDNMVTHVNLSLPSARVIDLSKAFGQPQYKLPSAKKTIETINNSINDKNVDNDHLQSMFSVLDNVLDISAKVIAGGDEETKELKRLYLEKKNRETTEDILIHNSSRFLDNTSSTTDAHRAVKAVFAMSMKNDYQFMEL